MSHRCPGSTPIPRQFIGAIRKGLVDAATAGPLGGYLLVVMVELYWQHEIATTAPGETIGKAVLSDFFNIEDSPSRRER